MTVPVNSILIIGSKRPGAIETAYARALDRLGRQVDHFDVDQSCASLMETRVINRLTQRLQWEIVGKSLFAFLQERQGQYEAIIVFKGMLLTPSWIARCKGVTSRATWINVNPDDPFNLVSRGSTNSNVLRSIRLYDVYATWGKHLIPSIRKHGCATVIFLPFAYDVDNHFPASTTGSYDPCVTFVGAWDPQREELLTKLADFPLRIHGGGWDRIRRRSPLRGKIHPANIYGEELRQVVSSATASINILRPQNRISHNMRTFEIPAMRGLMMTGYSEEQNSFFPDGQASLMYFDATDLRRKLSLVMEGANTIDGIKEAALTLCRGQSYDDRARTLYDAIVLFERNRVAA